jgi:hypothetical protein
VDSSSTPSKVAPTFHRRRAAAGVFFATVFLLFVNLSDHFERGEDDQGPFDPGWVMCDTIAYGWPAPAARWPAHHAPLDCHEPECSPPVPTCETALPDLDAISFAIDLAAAGSLLSASFLIFGGFRAGLRLLLHHQPRLQSGDNPHP